MILKVRFVKAETKEELGKRTFYSWMEMYECMWRLEKKYGDDYFWMFYEEIKND